MTNIIKTIKRLIINIRKDKSFEATKTSAIDEQTEQMLKDVADYFNHHISQVKDLYLKLDKDLYKLVKLECAMKDLHFIAQPNQKEIESLLNHNLDGWFSVKSDTDPLVKRILISLLRK